MKLMIVLGSAVLCAIAAALVGTHLGGGDVPPSPSTMAPAATSVADLPASPPSTPAVPSTSAAAPPAPPADPVLAAVDDCLQDANIVCARNALEPTVFAKTATPQQAQVLYDLCEIAVDSACKARIAKAYPKVGRDPRRTLTVHLPVEPKPALSSKLSSLRVSEQAQAMTGSSAADARAIAATDPAGARAILEPKVFSHQASTEEASLLWSVCKAQKDKDCRAKIDELYPGLPH